MTNIVTANLAKSRFYRCPPLYQYNYGMVLRITGIDLPDAYQVDFANDINGQSITQIGGADGVTIPSQFFQPGQAIYAWLRVHPTVDSGVTTATIVIPISPRAVITDDEPTPEQQSAIDQAIAALNDAANRQRVTSLDSTLLGTGTVIEAVGIPQYVSDVSQYAAYGMTDTGWYLFVRVAGKTGVTVTDGAEVTGALAILTPGADHVDLAVRFEVAAVSQAVTINWGAVSETIIFKATDLAVRNLDYMTTFYVYDISRYVTWEYALTTDTVFAANKQYYTKDGDVYTSATVTAGEAVPADTYYNHSKVHFEGMTPNVTYKLDELVDCPIEIALPNIPENGHGAWFEIQMRFNATYSITLLPVTEVKIGTAQTQAQTAGINTVDLQYTAVNGVKMWTLLNTHSNIPTT